MARYGTLQQIGKRLLVFMPSQITLSQEPTEPGDAGNPAPRYQDAHSRSESPQLVASTKLVPRRYVWCDTFCFALSRYPSFSDVPTKKGHLMILVDATQDIWERRWFVLRR